MSMRVKKRVLIVDDDADFVELLHYRFEHCGYEFTVARDGIEALKHAREFAPHLILMDVLLPDLDGLTLCSILRNEPQTRFSPIIVLSGINTDVTRYSALAAGAACFFAKPFDFISLEKAIEDVLRLRPDTKHGPTREKNQELGYATASDAKP